MLNKEFIDKVMNTNYDCDTERAEVRVFAKQIELRSNITGIYVKDNIIYLCNNSEPYTNSNYLTYTTLCEKLGEFPDDYSNYVAKEFENYLNKYGWDKLYIRDNKPIKFTDLDQHIQRLYYNQAQTLTQFLQILQYDNFNQLKTNFTQLKAILPFININDYSSFDLFNVYMENILKEYIGEYTTEAKIKSEEIYKIKKLNNETEKEYLNRITLAFEDYLKWLQDIYPEEPYFIKELVQYQTIHYDYNVDSLNVAAASAVAFWQLRKRLSKPVCFATHGFTITLQLQSLPGCCEPSRQSEQQECPTYQSRIWG